MEYKCKECGDFLTKFEIINGCPSCGIQLKKHSIDERAKAIAHAFINPELDNACELVDKLEQEIESHASQSVSRRQQVMYENCKRLDVYCQANAVSFTDHILKYLGTGELPKELKH